MRVGPQFKSCLQLYSVLSGSKSAKLLEQMHRYPNGKIDSVLSCVAFEESWGDRVLSSYLEDACDIVYRPVPMSYLQFGNTGDCILVRALRLLTAFASIDPLRVR